MPYYPNVPGFSQVPRKRIQLTVGGTADDASRNIAIQVSDAQGNALSGQRLLQAWLTTDPEALALWSAWDNAVIGATGGSIGADAPLLADYPWSLSTNAAGHVDLDVSIAPADDTWRFSAQGTPPSMGTGTISNQGETTGVLDYDIDAADLQAALRLLPSLGTAVSVTGGPIPVTPFEVTVDLGAVDDFPDFTFNNIDMDNTAPGFDNNDGPATPVTAYLAATVDNSGLVFVSDPIDFAGGA